MIEQFNIFDFVEEEKVNEETLQKKHDKKFQQKKLTSEEWECYRIIRENSLLGKKTTQKELCNRLGLKYNDDIKAHDPCPKIWTMISHINLSFEVEKIIITHEFNYWLGCEEETKVFMEKLWNDLAPRLSRYWAFLKKLKRNGQGKLFSTQLAPIDDDSQARAFVESYLDKGD